MEPPRALRHTRAAVVGLFFLCGLTLAMWVVNIPAVQAATGVSHPVLGSLLLLIGLGSFIGMQAGGPILDRVGSKPAAAVSALLLVVAVNLPGLATNAWELGAGLFVLGLGSGGLDVAMNDQAVHIERRYGRPIMSSFHAFFSVGGGVGALMGAGLQSAGLPTQASLGAGAVIATAIAVLSLPLLLERSADGGDAPRAGESTRGARRTVRHVRGQIILLASLAFLLMLAEGTANDWSALHAVESLGQTPAVASLAFGAFAVAMTVGRFAADAVSHRFGAANVVRFGSALAAAGMLAVVVSPLYPLTLAGWAVFGLGLSGIVPQIFTTAGNLGVANQGTVIAWVVGAGYIGLLAGPAVIGWVSGGVGLAAALVIPVLCCGVGLGLSGRVATAGGAAQSVTG